MKLCMVIGSLGSGGAERVAATLASHWVQNGWQVTIVTISGEYADFYSLHTSVKRVALDMAKASDGALSGVWNNLLRVRALRRFLKRERPDITLGFMPEPNILCKLATMGSDLVTVGSEHIHPPMMPLSRVWQTLRWLVYPRLAFVSALTDESAQWLKVNTGANRVHVIPNPVTYPLSLQEPCVDPASLRADLGGKNWLLAVGRLVEQKGFDRLLAAFSELAPQHLSWQLIILGEGPLRLSLERQVTDLGLSDRVVLPGAVGNLGEWYETADAYAMTSRFEGFGNTLAEALAHGLPAVAVDCETGPRDILRHEIDGLLVPQDDAIALVRAIERLIRDDALRVRFGARAIEARERFAVGKVAGLWETLLESCMSNR